MQPQMEAWTSTKTLMLLELVRGNQEKFRMITSGKTQPLPLNTSPEVITNRRWSTKCRGSSRGFKAVETNRYGRHLRLQREPESIEINRIIDLDREVSWKVLILASRDHLNSRIGCILISLCPGIGMWLHQCWLVNTKAKIKAQL